MFTIQSDWNDIIKQPKGEIWITCKTMGRNGIHSSIAIKDSKPMTSPELKIIYSSNNHMKVLHKESNCLYGFIAPVHTFSSIHSKGISCIDTSFGGLGVSVCSDNKLRVWETSNGVLRRDLSGHVFEAYNCRFFPSGEVILSGGSDMQLKIWSAITGECALTLIGHKSAIMDTSIIDRGKNIITVSRDGTAKLWNLGHKTCIEDLIQLAFGNCINTCALQTIESDLDLGSRELPISPLSVGTLNKLLLIGCESGDMYGIGLNSRKKIFELKNTSAVNSCCFINEFNFIFGTQSGEIQLMDARNVEKVIKSWEVSASPVLHLLSQTHNKSQGFFVGRADGSAVYHYIDKEETFQLTGPDFEAINRISSDGKHIYTASRDGNIRKYNINVKSNLE